MENVRVLNVDILSIKKKELLERLERGALFTPNVDHLVRLQKDRKFYEAYRQADLVVCDSVILHRISKLLKRGIIESIPGSTFFREYCDYHREDEGCRIFILGGKEGVSQRAMENINRRMGRRMVVGACSPSFYFVEDEKKSLEFVRMINHFDQQQRFRKHVEDWCKAIRYYLAHDDDQREKAKAFHRYLKEECGEKQFAKTVAKMVRV